MVFLFAQQLNGSMFTDRLNCVRHDWIANAIWFYDVYEHRNVMFIARVQCLLPSNGRNHAIRLNARIIYRIHIFKIV